MVKKISPAALKAMLKGKSPFALIDVREEGEFNSSHIPGSSWIPRRQLEFRMSFMVPNIRAHVVVCDDDGRRSELAAETLNRVGYSHVSLLTGGINRWAYENYATEWGLNVASKEFGERVKEEHQVPEIEATELYERMESDNKLIVLDPRTPEEFHSFCIPGAYNVPGVELGYRITDIVKHMDKDCTICVSCAGRTRGIIGARSLQRMGLPNVYSLKNGTMGWVLASYQLEKGADRVSLPKVSKEGVAEAEEYATRLAAEDGVRYLDIRGLQKLMDRREQETVYLIDVRTKEEYQQGHIPGFRWLSGGQVVQQSDMLAVKNSTIVFVCDGKARAIFTASWYRQMGFVDIYVVDGGTTAWSAAHLNLEKGMPDPPPFGLEEAREKVRLLSPVELRASQIPVVIFVDTSFDFARSHVHGAQWVPRGWLELWIANIAPSKDTPIAVTCFTGLNATLAGATLVELGYRDVSVLEGGITACQEQADYPLECGLCGVMTQPRDLVYSEIDPNYAEMIEYLRWEVALGKNYKKHPK